MPKRTRDYRESLLEDLQDANEASAYLNAALEDSEEMFLVALRDVADSRQIAKVAMDAGITREHIYRMLSKSGNPRLSSLTGILDAVGLEMRLCPKEEIHSGPGGPAGFSLTTANAIGKALGPVGIQSGAKRKVPQMRSDCGSQIGNNSVLRRTGT